MRLFDFMCNKIKRMFSANKSGDNSSINEQKSVFELWKRNAEHGDAGAQFKLGLCYYDGVGVEKDDVKAVEWYRKSAEQGHASAQYFLSFCYYDGVGVEKDDVEAVEWYRKSAEQGNVNAQNKLGVCYVNGWGVEKDYTEAVKWFRRASEQGEEEKTSEEQISLNTEEYKIDDPKAVIRLNVRGHITDTIVKPSFNAECNGAGIAFGVMVMSFLGEYLFDVIEMEDLFRFLFPLILPVLWVVGYSLVKKWNPMGKYLMCGSIYMLINFLLVYCCVCIYCLICEILPSNRDYWYDYILPILRVLASFLILLFLILCCYMSIEYIKKGKHYNPNVWAYSGNRFIPAIMEFIIPIFYLIIFSIVIYFTEFTMDKKINDGSAVSVP